MRELRQRPTPGTQFIRYQGDALALSLELPAPQVGAAWVRTNLGRADMRHTEIVQHVENDEPILAHDWHDIPMSNAEPGRYSLSLALTEVGRFEAKAFFLPDGSDEPVWPEGDNVVIKVEPGAYCCANSIYTAFVRQFGPCKSECADCDDERVAELEKKGYAVIPRSGTFRDLAKEVPFITDTLGCRIIQLLPIHPVPTTYARMGRFGSPFAALDFSDVDPALAEFDRRTTPLEQFGELVDEVHRCSAKIFLDIPINHTGWASKLQIDHPEWFARGEDRSFVSPGAWGVTWEDLARLDYRHRDLWKHMANVFLFWCDREVDGFRCDAGYMVPYAVWEYITAKVRLRYPDTVFILEGLGGRLETVVGLLDGANLDWAYSELFQNYDRAQVESYLPGAIEMSTTKGTLVHYSETHDNNRLASVSTNFARMRTALAALCSHDGAFGITNGVEWFAQTKIDVHGSPPLNWGNDDNQVEHLAQLNHILENHPCFHPGAELRLLRQEANTAVLLRQSADGAHRLLVVANLDHDRSNDTSWPAGEFPADSEHVDLVTGARVTPEPHGDRIRLTLEPGRVMCLSRAPLAVEDGPGPQRPERTLRQRLKAKALEARSVFRPHEDLSGIDTESLASALAEDPAAFCREASGCERAPVTHWRWPADARRTVMVPPGHFLFIQASSPFSAALGAGNRPALREHSLPRNDGTEFILLAPVHDQSRDGHCFLDLVVYDPSTRHVRADLLYLPPATEASVRTALGKRDVEAFESYALCTNGRGAMAQVRGVWSEIRSQYDAMLAANLSEEHPVDRHVMLTRCRAWLVCRGYSQEIDRNCLSSFGVAEDGSVCWQFNVPAGRSKTVRLMVRLQMHQDRNAIAVTFERPRSTGTPDDLDDAATVQIIVRPDIEDRNNHAKTKAYTGLERTWPGAIAPREDGFNFAPAADRRLDVSVPKGSFVPEPEWAYGVRHPLEAERGLDASSDLFSPGYFSLHLQGGETRLLHASVSEAGPGDTTPDTPSPWPGPDDAHMPLEQALLRAMRQFIVKRDSSRTVIAGYPWFLDWGRDTLICLRGMIAAGMLQEVRDILLQFARFEEQGTLPNMIRGNDVSDRDTSDAPLWFFVACADLIRAEESNDFLETDCGGRTVEKVLLSIAGNYAKGTPNGIEMDSDSGLIFSPAHFTWMDTNYPACTPRQGYPIEIQALWHFALRFLDRVKAKGNWRPLADRVQDSILEHFAQTSNTEHRTPLARHSPGDGGNTEHFLSDCLHASHGQPAREAVADDHLRPNQLLALTLGAVTDKTLATGVLRACEELLVPGAIRSLADRPCEFHLPLKHRGRQLNDPANPYWGTYAGDEDTRRKPAYHNGTAWTWPFPSYCEALFITYGEETRNAALSLLRSSRLAMDRGCIGQIPEILDGDSPHQQRGCGAQAWGVTELLRVRRILTKS